MSGKKRKKSQDIGSAVELIKGDAAAQAALKTNDQIREVDAIDKVYGDNLPYNRDRVIEQCKLFIGDMAQAYKELGKRLILIRAHEPHGRFLRVIEELGLQPRVAQRAIFIARKAQEDPHFFNTFGRLQWSKVRALASANDEDVERFQEQFPVEEMARMTCVEFEEELKKSKETIRQKAEEAHRLELENRNLRKLIENRPHESDEIIIADLNMRLENIAGELSGACRAPGDLAKRSPETRELILAFFDKANRLAKAYGHATITDGNYTPAEVNNILAGAGHGLDEERLFYIPPHEEQPTAS